MKIENLSKELETQDMTEVHGGTALTGQVVPTNVQCNAAGPEVQCRLLRPCRDRQQRGSVQLLFAVTRSTRLDRCS